MGRFDIRTRSGLLSTIVQGQTASPSDGDAQAFIYRVESAGGTLTTTEKDSVNTLVIRLKAANIWTKLLAVYPMVGASAPACAQNLKSSSFTGSFATGWTFASTGITGNGTTSYMNTGLNLSTATPIYNVHFSLYVRNDTNVGLDIGATTSNPYTQEGLMAVRDAGNFVAGIYDAFGAGMGSVSAANANSQGFYVASAIASNNIFIAKNSVVQGTWTTANTSIPANGNVYIGAINDVSSNNALLYTTRQYAFASIGNGLTTTEASDFYNIVQEFQTLLGRQIGAPAVSDADASAFIQRVYTAGGTLTTAEQNAVNQLTIDLKAASIWTGMKAVYPMVGASAAACAQNLRTGSFTGTFNGTITYATTGITGNAVNGYMNTGLNASTVLTPANNHISFYSRNNPTPSTVMEIGANTDQNGYNGPYLRVRLTGFGSTDQLYYASGDNISSPFAATSSNLDSRGYFIGNILSTTNRKVYKNGSLGGTNTTSGANSLSNANIYVLANGGAGGTPSFYSNKECAFASIGDGLTDTQATYLNNAVETFQTSLSRNVGAIIPTVSDADAQAYVTRVYGAGGTLSATELNAVNQFTLQLKAAGLWTLMKAMYPMVGASAAACAQNLKSSLYTGTFSGAITYSSAGIIGDGATGYMNTGLNASTVLTAANNHISFYSRSNPTPGPSIEMGAGEAGSGYQGPFFRIRLDGYGFTNTFRYDNGPAVGAATVNSTNLDSRGHFIGNILATTNRKSYKNGVVSGTLTTDIANSLANGNIYLLASNSVPSSPGFYSTKQCSFASIGDGLTDTQASDFYTIVQQLQTTLSRNV